MSRFYGTLRGGRGPATRCGHRHMTATAASWAGSVEVHMFLGPDDVEMFEVHMMPWHGNGDRKMLCRGVVGNQETVRFNLPTSDTPRLYRNHYRCPDDGTEWTDEWDCMCNDKCPTCNAEIEPYRSEDLT